MYMYHFSLLSNLSIFLSYCTVKSRAVPCYTQAKEEQLQQFEGQKESQDLTTAEQEEIAVRKRRAEGTPCTDETFYAWLQKFEEERAQKEAEEELAAEERGGSGGGGKKKSGEKVDITKDRLTGFEQFSGKVGIMSLEAIEAAAEEAENESGDEVDMDDLDENLFDDDDDLDDLDFDSSDANDDLDSDEDEPDIQLLEFLPVPTLYIESNRPTCSRESFALALRQIKDVLARGDSLQHVATCTG